MNATQTTNGKGNAMVAEIRKVLKENGLYLSGKSGRLGGLGATRIRDCGGYVVVIPRSGVRDVSRRDSMLKTLRESGYDARESGTGPNTSGEMDILVFCG